MRKKNPAAAATLLLILLILPVTILASRFLLEQNNLLWERSSGAGRIKLATGSSSLRRHPSAVVIGDHAAASFSGSSRGRKLFLAAVRRELQAHRHHHRLRRSQLTRSTVLNSHEIDPRYGVEKRLVPSGPNPLHN